MNLSESAKIVGLSQAEEHEVFHGMTARIGDLKERIAVNVELASSSRLDATGNAEAAGRAVECSRRLRQAEFAYLKLGGPVVECRPVLHRGRV